MTTNIQSKLAIALTSGTTWSMIALVVYNAVQVNLNLFPAGATPFVNILLLILGTYLHSNHVQSAAQLGSTHV